MRKRSHLTMLADEVFHAFGMSNTAVSVVAKAIQQEPKLAAAACRLMAKAALEAARRRAAPKRKRKRTK